LLNRILSGWRNPHYVQGIHYFNRRDFSRALEEFDQLLTGHEDRSSLDVELARFYAAEAHTRLGLDYYRRHDFDLAKREFQTALQVEGSFPDLYYLLGNLAEREGRGQDAVALLDRALELNPHHREALACRALVHRAAGRMGPAREDLMRLVASGFPVPEIPSFQARAPVRVHILEDLKGERQPDGHLSGMLGCYDRGLLCESLEALGVAIDEEPGYADLRFRQGQLLVEMNRLHEAVASFDGALGLNPDFLEAQLARGVCLLALNRPDRAERTLAHAASLRPTYADVAFLHGLALSRMGHLQEALLPLERAVSVNPGFWKAHLVMGQVHASLGDLERGFESLRAALMHQIPEPRDMNLAGGSAPRGSGGVAFLEGAVAAHPDYPDLRLQLGIAHLAEGQTSLAREAFQEALRLNPSYADAHTHLAKVEARQGRPLAAIPHLDRAVALDSRRADVYCLLGESRLAVGDASGSAEAFEAALVLNRRYVGALLGLAAVRLSQERRSPARELYRKVLAIRPGHPIATRQLTRLEERRTPQTADLG
jgi:tetratricopeptide (TPR) repeat protein